MENNNPNNQPGQEDIPFIPDTKVMPVQKKNHLDKLAEVFLPEDLDSIGNRIITNVIIPNILKTAGDIIHKSVDMIFGTNYSGPVTPPSQNVPARNYTAYQSATPSSASTGTMQILPVRSGVYDYSEVRFRSIAHAQGVLNNMRSVLSNTGRVSVGKYLEFAGASTIPEDYNYGWTQLKDVYVTETGDRDFPYRMVLPATVVLTGEGSRRYI